MTTATPKEETQRVRLNLTPRVAELLRAQAKADNRTLSGYVTNLVDKADAAE